MPPAQLTSSGYRVAGAVIVSGDPGYDDARHVYNFMIDKHPAAVVRCTNTSDVQAVLAHAPGSGRDLPVRGGGHSVPGFGTAHGALVADPSLMNPRLGDSRPGTAPARGGATPAQPD